MQPFKQFEVMWRRVLALAAIFVCGAVAGCGGGEKAAAGGGAQASSSSAAKTAGTPAPAVAASTALTARPTQFLSVFSTNDLRDPFHPMMRPRTATVAATGPSATGPADVVAALERGFKGTFGPPTERLALIHGAVLEQNLETTLSLPIQGVLRRVKVKPVRILRDSVEMQVEGVPSLVTLKVRR